ncbi:MAG: methionyl-tRNA formyltransferase [Firmicutes bacterium]|nr:methionyl-tRNA formyltransferase [Bacillota bacterium]
MNIVFMGTPDFAVPTLNSIYKKGYNVSLVVTQPDRKKGRGKKLTPTPVKQKALDFGIEVFQPENINVEENIEKIKKYNPDVIVVVAYGQILRKDILDIPKKGCINVHASLLPSYRGAAPINWVVINGEDKTGVTTMYMEEGLDTGDMILKEEIAIKENDTAGVIHDKLMDLGANLLIKTLDIIDKGEVKRTPQDDVNSSYAPMMDKELGKIDWNKPKRSIKNLVRGTNPWPCAFTYYNGKKMKIHRVEIGSEMKGTNGEIIKVNDEGIYVSVKDGSIIIKKIQFPGKRPMEVKDYLRGNEIETNIILG